MSQISDETINLSEPIKIEEVKSPSEIENDAALRLVVQDAQNTETWLQSNYWTLRWREADVLYQSPPLITMWEGTTLPRSNINRFVVAETLNSIHPQIMHGLFYEDPPFIIRKNPTISEATREAKAALLALQLKETNFQEEVDWGLFSALLFGTGIWKWGFKSYTRKKVRYVQQRKESIIPSDIGGPPTIIDTEDSSIYLKVEEEEQVYSPTFEYRDGRYVLVSPDCRLPDIRKAKFVIDRMYVTYRDLLRLKDEEYVVVEDGKQILKKRYNLPSEEEIKSWFEPPVNPPTPNPGGEAVNVLASTYIHHAKPQFEKTTEDPLDEPLEILERWDNDKVITVLQRVKVIRNEPNEFGVIPFLSVNFWNIPDAFWGMGLGRIIGQEQRVQVGIINACLDLASLILNPMFVRSRSANVQTQQIRQRLGGIIEVDGDPKRAFSIIEQPHIPGEIIQQLVLSQARVEKTSGAHEQLVVGSSSASGTSLARSGTGAAGIIQATMNRLGAFAENFVRQVYKPLLYYFDQLNKEKLPAAYVRKIIGEKLGEDFKFDMGEFLNSKTEFDVLAGSHLASRGAMGQYLFTLLQILENPRIMEQLATVSHKKINVNNLIRLIHDLSGWKNYDDIVEDMTPEEVQNMMTAKNDALAGVQSQLLLNQQKFEQDRQLIDQENNARVARDFFKQAIQAMVKGE